MIRDIKFGLAFIAGAAYAGCWWILSVWGFPTNPIGPVPGMAYTAMGVGTGLIIIAVIISLATHWREDSRGR